MDLYLWQVTWVGLYFDELGEFVGGFILAWNSGMSSWVWMNGVWKSGCYSVKEEPVREHWPWNGRMGNKSLSRDSEKGSRHHTDTREGGSWTGKSRERQVLLFRTDFCFFVHESYRSESAQTRSPEIVRAMETLPGWDEALRAHASRKTINR